MIGAHFTVRLLVVSGFFQFYSQDDYCGIETKNFVTFANLVVASCAIVDWC